MRSEDRTGREKERASMTNRFQPWGSGVLLALIVTALVVLPANGQNATETLYKTKCASCHAADGGGDTPVGKKLGARDFRSAQVQKQTDAQLVEITAKGKNKMPGYEKKLTDEQIKQLVDYVRALGKKK
jgi:mono/diheme cytochrome c family protein